VHDTVPVLEANRPAAQPIQEAKPAPAAKAPAAHGAQVDSNESPGVVEKSPPMQAVQLVAPMVAE
jgi:hypothetical protein